MRLLPILLAGAVVIACAPADRELRLARLAAERRDLEATFEHLEDRLLVNQSRVRFWREMRARHESISAVACASLEHHAHEMALRDVSPPPSPGPARARERKRVASAAPLAAERVTARAARR